MYQKECASTDFCHNHIIMVKVKGDNYWRDRRRKQGSRALRKAAAAYSQPSVEGIAKAAWSGVKYLRTLVNSEVHKRETGPASQAISTTPTVFHLTAISQGDLDTDRTGLSIYLSYVSLRLYFSVHASATSSIVRVILVQDKQQIGDTTPGMADVISSASTLAHYNNNTVGRFTIMMDETFWLDQGMYRTHIIKKFKKINSHVRFNGTSSLDIQKQGLYLMMISTEATNTPTMNYSVRTAWHDN